MKDDDKAIRAAKLTLGAMLEKRRAKEAKTRAGGQTAPSQYLPDVPRQAHAYGGYVPQASLPIPRLAVAAPLRQAQQPTAMDTLSSLAALGKTATGLLGREESAPPEGAQQHYAGDGHDHGAPSADHGGMSEAALAAWGRLTDAYGQPLTVNSAYRDPKRNEEVGGANNSQHMHGNAYDVDVSHLSYEDRLALADQAWNAGFRGIGFYDTAMHFDVADPRAWGPSYSRDSIPDWAQDWTANRYGYADGGEVTPSPQQPVDLGQVREQKQLQTYHSGLMDDISTRMSERMEAHQKALDAGVFDGYEVGDTFKGKNAPMKITGRFVRPWKPTRMTLDHFERMGAKPTIIEHEGKQYIPMLRTLTGNKDTDDWQEGDAYLDGFKAIGYPKMGGLRAVKADGGSVTDARAAFLEGNHPLVPDVLYHGTSRDIRSFDPEAKRSYDVDPTNPDDTDTGWFGKGHYFTAIPKMADHYANEGARRSGGEGANVMPVHVSMKNPFVVDMREYDSGATTLDKALTRMGVPPHPRGWRKPSEQTAALIAMGHDGVIATREGKPKEYVAFHPHQIKSAISATTFDPTETDITRAAGGAANAPMFEGIHEDLQDDEGKPLELWHGTPHPEEFEAFDDAKIGSNTDHGWRGRGHYLTPEEGLADAYADPDMIGEGTVIGPLHAALKNPYIWDTSSDNAAHRTLRDLQSMGLMTGQGKLEPHHIIEGRDMDQFMQHMQERGHDGVLVKTKDHTGKRPHQITEVVVFKPTAIKHRDAEAFDPTDPRIRRAAGGAAYDAAMAAIRRNK